MLVQIPQDLTRLQAECASRFANHPTVGFAVGEILRRLSDDVWENDQGVPKATADLLNAKISPLLDAVFHATTDSQLLAATDDLVVVWRRVAPLI